MHPELRLWVELCELVPTLITNESTTLKESFDQLVYLQDKHNSHRRYLVHQCWTFTPSLALIRPGHLDFLENSDITRELCPCIDMDLEKVAFD